MSWPFVLPMSWHRTEAHPHQSWAPLCLTTVTTRIVSKAFRSFNRPTESEPQREICVICVIRLRFAMARQVLRMIPSNRENIPIRYLSISIPEVTHAAILGHYRDHALGIVSGEPVSRAMPSARLICALRN
jgi:hypothetical protein